MLRLRDLRAQRYEIHHSTAIFNLKLTMDASIKLHESPSVVYVVVTWCEVSKSTERLLLAPGVSRTGQTPLGAFRRMCFKVRLDNDKGEAYACLLLFPKEQGNGHNSGHKR